MTPDLAHDLVIRPALGWMGHPYDSVEARRFLIAAGYHESGLEHVKQHRGGPANGWFQFERIGVQGVIGHPSFRRFERFVWDLSGKKNPTVARVHMALGSWRVESLWLSVVFARALTWRHPDPIPTNPTEAYQYYDRLWRPGAKRPDAWPDAWQVACLLCGYPWRTEG